MNIAPATAAPRTAAVVASDPIAEDLSNRGVRMSSVSFPRSEAGLVACHYRLCGSGFNGLPGYGGTGGKSGRW
jgi:hypothetical protein